MTNDRVKGCLYGGAAGDALGYEIEFMRENEIFSKYGKDGIQDYVYGENGRAFISDDTQMTLFESEIAEYIDLKKAKGNDSEESAERLSPELQNMILFADDLTKNDVKEIYYAMQEKSYENIFLSFKRLYQTAVNNDPANLKAYILGIIRNEKI